MDEAASQSPRPKIGFVSTRALDGESMAGRLHVAHSIRTALSGYADLTFHRIPSVLTDPAIGRGIGALIAVLASVVRGPVLPVQCAIFANQADLKALIEALPQDLDAAYLDGVRSYAFLKELRRQRPNLRIVTDLDDLMSRRMDLLLEANQPLSPGYLTKRLPLPIRRLIMSRRIGREIVSFERKTLRGVESQICELSDAVVLLSERDAAVLQIFADQKRAKIIVIAPPSRPPIHPHPFIAPERFVFIGSDALTQNRLTIDYLLDLWRTRNIQTPLVLYGLHYRDLALPPGVTVAGYVDRIEEVYDGRSVLITPSLIGGGIKTKVLEAFAYGAPVIGNACTFESMRLEGYPLNLEGEDVIAALAQSPDDYQVVFANAVDAGARYIAQFHNGADFVHRWRALMTPNQLPEHADA